MNFNEILEEHAEWLRTDGHEGRRGNFDFQTLKYMTLEKKCLDEVTFFGSNLKYCEINNSFLSNVDFTCCDLRNSNLVSTTFTYSCFQHADLRDVSVINCGFDRCDFKYAKLPWAEKLLLANWGLVNQNLTSDLINYEMFTLGRRMAFEDWAKDTERYPILPNDRLINFLPDKTLYRPDRKINSSGQLINRLFKEKGIIA